MKHEKEIKSEMLRIRATPRHRVMLDLLTSSACAKNRSRYVLALLEREAARLGLTIESESREKVAA